MNIDFSSWSINERTSAPLTRVVRRVVLIRHQTGSFFFFWLFSRKAYPRPVNRTVSSRELHKQGEYAPFICVFGINRQCKYSYSSHTSKLLHNATHKKVG